MTFGLLLILMVFMALLVSILLWIFRKPVVDSIVCQRDYPNNDHYKNYFEFITHTMTLLLVLGGLMVRLQQFVDFLYLR